MRRHVATVHGDKKYVCKCSYSTGRKDNYTRHLKDSCKLKDKAGQLFICICGKTFDNFNSHLTHVQTCGKRRAGRPSSSSKNST
ncbi:hypothetical protein GQ607_017721 [Colletotrichum asianum]|uniref:C2H2-type domain-containing protein n=1 Tax=Colletotrichum asianum TaxID=702518 RepID=A0A8H3VTG4_9PEZI|nr:hypothetical protein GQ607_017721 [Colletotrichum asianum]